MASPCRYPKGNKTSIKYWWVPLEVQSFETSVICSSEDTSRQLPISCTKNSSKSEAKSSINRVSTSQLVSAAAGLWGSVCQPAVFQTKAGFGYEDICQKGDIICYSDSQRKNKSSTSVEKKVICLDLKSESYFSSSAKSNFENLKTIKKMLLFASCNTSINNSFIWEDPHSQANYPTNLINNVKSTIQNDLVEFTEDASDRKYENNMIGGKDNLAERTPRSTEISVPYDGINSSGKQTIESAEYINQPPNGLYSAYSLETLKSTNKAGIVLKSSRTGLHSDCNIDCLPSLDCAYEQCEQVTKPCSVVVGSSLPVSNSKGHKTDEGGRSILQEHALEEELHNLLSIQDKLQKTFSKNRHALAGALAGTLVSLCLHPVDTVKTVIQVNGVSQKSFHDIFRTIISEKGVLGLYRGVASNIASSAPISAIYTCTYESVKGTLIPLLPKEYHSLAHCIAGGCSSVATSFIFTPSERIKQQMQVGSQYQNCWNALIGCLEKGGVSSLYAGWSAVLCRNIPHSIIKFYTYERLKKLFSSLKKSDAPPGTIQTLICGGLAGSTAALFTTPFDVVKTRLQTQAPGSLAKYNGVIHALQEIAREEGLQGLYRGLTPRLAMYVSQGAIFFASYEFLKAVFALEVPRVPTLLISEKEHKTVEIAE